MPNLPISATAVDTLPGRIARGLFEHSDDILECFLCVRSYWRDGLAEGLCVIESAGELWVPMLVISILGHPSISPTIFCPLAG
jgi:hypothetical protein